jgi:hypothetical protein
MPLQNYASTDKEEKKSYFPSDLKWVVVGATGATALILLYNKVASLSQVRQPKKGRSLGTTDQPFSKFGEKKQQKNSSSSLDTIKNFTTKKVGSKLLSSDLFLVLTTGLCASLLAKYFSPPVLEEQKTPIGTKFFSIPNQWLLIAVCSICYCILRCTTHSFSV